jgi:hypothetical protein
VPFGDDEGGDDGLVVGDRDDAEVLIPGRRRLL